MWDLIVSVPDHCLSFYLVLVLLTKLIAESIGHSQSWGTMVIFRFDNSVVRQWNVRHCVLALLPVTCIYAPCIHW